MMRFRNGVAAATTQRDALPDNERPHLGMPDQLHVRMLR